MGTPSLTNEFNGASNLLTKLFMWLLGMDGNDGQGQSFMDMLKKLFSPDSSTPGTAPSTQNGTDPAPVTSNTDPAPVKTETGGAPKAARNVVTIGDSLAQGYGQALSKEFGAANVTNYGVVGAGLKGGTHLAQVDWGKINKDTVAVISVGTNDVGFLSYKNQTKIDEYAQQVVAIASRVKDNGGTPVMIAMRAPDKPLDVRDNVTKQMRQQTPEEFDAWKKTMTAMNDAMAKVAAEKGIPYVTPEGGSYVAGGLHQTLGGYQTTADNALRTAGVTVTNG